MTMGEEPVAQIDTHVSEALLKAEQNSVPRLRQIHRYLMGDLFQLLPDIVPGSAVKVPLVRILSKLVAFEIPGSLKTRYYQSGTIATSNRRAAVSVRDLQPNELCRMLRHVSSEIRHYIIISSTPPI